jgi:hypothetical protein
MMLFLRLKFNLNYLINYLLPIPGQKGHLSHSRQSTVTTGRRSLRSPWRRNGRPENDPDR